MTIKAFGGSINIKCLDLWNATTLVGNSLTDSAQISLRLI